MKAFFSLIGLTFSIFSYAVETPVTASLAATPSTEFIGNWVAERCVDASPDRLPSERAQGEEEMLRVSGSLSIGADFFASTGVPTDRPADAFITAKVAKQVYSVRRGTGNRVVVVTLYQRNAPGTDATEVPFISSSIRDYELLDNGKLLQRRRGITYEFSDPTKLTSGSYEAFCTFRRK